METKQNSWQHADEWGIKEFLLLLLVEFGLVVWGIKFIVQPFVSQWFNNDLYAGTFLGLIMAIVLLVSIYIIALRPNRLTWGEVGVRSFDPKRWKLIIIGTIVLMIGVVVITLITSLVGNTWENSKTEALQDNISIHGVLIALVSAAVISPIYEEIFYRGFLFRWLRTRIGFGGAALFSSLIFSIVHIPTYNVIPVAFFSGLIFAFAYEKTGSIWPAVIIHGLSNGIMVLLTTIP